MKTSLGVLTGLGIWLACFLAGIILYDTFNVPLPIAGFVPPVLLVIIGIFVFRKITKESSQFLVGLLGVIAFATLISSICGIGFAN